MPERDANNGTSIRRIAASRAHLLEYTRFSVFLESVIELIARRTYVRSFCHFFANGHRSALTIT